MPYKLGVMLLSYFWGKTVRKLEIRDAEMMRIAIRQEIGRSDESRYDHRLHGVLLVASGRSCAAVADLFGEDVRTVQRWAHRFESGGFESLREGERAGRPRRLDARQWLRLERELRRNPHEFGHEQNFWDGKLLSEHLRKHYQVSLGIRQCQRIFHRMGFRLRKPRPQGVQADPVRVAAVKKTAPPRPTR